MEIIEFTDRQRDGRYKYREWYLGNEYKHIKGLEAIYISNEHEYTDWYGSYTQGSQYETLVKNNIEYKFYIPYFDVYRIYRNDIRRKTKFSRFLDECEFNTRFELDCILDPSKKNISQ